MSLQPAPIPALASRVLESRIGFSNPFTPILGGRMREVRTKGGMRIVRRMRRMVMVRIVRVRRMVSIIMIRVMMKRRMVMSMMVMRMMVVRMIRTRRIIMMRI